MGACAIGPNYNNKNTMDPLLAQDGVLSVRLIDQAWAQQTLPKSLLLKPIEGEKYLVVYVDDERAISACRLIESHNCKDLKNLTSAANFTSDQLILQNQDKRFLEVSVLYLEDDHGHRAQGLLWQAARRYCAHQHIDFVMSRVFFPGKYPASHALSLSYLYHFHRTKGALATKARHGASMDIMPPEAIHPREAFSQLPPILRFFLRHGAKVGDGIAVNKMKEKLAVFVIFASSEL